MNVDISQKEFIETSFENIRLLAPAGSGKTLSILWRCKYLFEKYPEKPQRFLIFTFTRVARDELFDRLSNDVNFACIRKNVKIDTLNRWGFNYLRKSIESNLALKTTSKEHYALVKHNLRPIWTKHEIVNKSLGGKQKRYTKLIEIIDALKTTGFRHDIQDISHEFMKHMEWLNANDLSRYYEANIEKPLQELDLLDTAENTQFKKIEKFLFFWKQACEHLWENAIITFDDQKYWTYLKLQEKYSNSVFPEPSRYHHIMVDEFQDINPLDLLLIKELVSANNSSLTIVGDDDQAIYEWRGTSPKFILYPEKFFDKEFQTYTLGTNYRSPSNILRHSQRLIWHNKHRFLKEIKAFKSDNAEIVHESFGTHGESTEFLLEIAKNANDEAVHKSLAVLARKKSQLIPLEITLTSNDIPFYAKEDLNVLLSDAFSDLKTILEAIASKNDRRNTNDIVNSFMSCINKVKYFPLPTVESKQLYSFLLSQRPKSFTDCLGKFQLYTGKLRSQSKENSILEYALPIAKILESKTVQDAIDEIENQMDGLQKHYGKAEDDIFYKDPPFLYLSEYAARYGNKFHDFIDHVEAAISQMSSNINTDEDSIDKDINLPVHLMTALRAKGKEFDTVVILDANDGMWPIKFATTEPELEQERRLFYVAVTRTRKKIIFVSVDTLHGNNLLVTPYLNEMGLSGIIKNTQNA